MSFSLFPSFLLGSDTEVPWTEEAFGICIFTDANLLMHLYWCSGKLRVPLLSFVAEIASACVRFFGASGMSG
jgi:hypothetical protein